MVRVERRGVRSGPLAALAAAVLLLHACGATPSPRLNSELPAPAGFSVTQDPANPSRLLLHWESPESGFDALIAEYSFDGQTWSALGQVTHAATSSSVPLPAEAIEASTLWLRLTVEQGTRQSPPATATILVPMHSALHVQALQAFADGPLLVQWQNDSPLADGVHIDRQLVGLDGGVSSLSTIDGLAVTDVGWQLDSDVSSWVEGARINYCVVYTLGDAGSAPACALSPYAPPLSPIDFVADAYDAGTRVALTWTTRSGIADSVGVLRLPLFHLDGGELFEVPATVSSASDTPPLGAWSYQLEARWHSPDGGVISSRSRFGYAVHEDPSWTGGFGASVASLPHAMQLQRLANGQVVTAMGPSTTTDSRYVWAAAEGDFGWLLGATTGDQVGLLPDSLMTQGSTASVLWLKSVGSTTAELHQLTWTDHWADVLASSEVSLGLSGAAVTHDVTGTYDLVSLGPDGITTVEGRDQTWSTLTAPVTGLPSQVYGLTSSDEGLRLLFAQTDGSLSLATRQGDGGWALEDVPPPSQSLNPASTHLVSAPGRLAFVYAQSDGASVDALFVQERTSAGWGAPVQVAQHTFDSWAYGVDVAYSPDGARLAVAITGESTPQLLVRDLGAWSSRALFPTTDTPVVGFTGSGKVWVLTGTTPSVEFPPTFGATGVDLVPYVSYFER